MIQRVAGHLRTESSDLLNSVVVARRVPLGDLPNVHVPFALR